MTTRLSFVRNGNVHNPKRVFCGRLPGFGLNEVGRRQARAVAEYLRSEPLAALYTSELRRARETAQEICSLHPGLSLLRSPLLLEVYSPYDGTPHDEMVARGWDLYQGIPPASIATFSYHTGDEAERPDIEHVVPYA